MCDDPIKDETAGFVFGNEAASCDVFVQGIRHLSKQLFAITINPTSGALMIKNRRPMGINVESNSLGRKLLNSKRALVPESIVVKLPDFNILIKVIDHTEYAALYKPYFTQFYMRIARSVPNLSALNLFSRYTSTQRSNPYLLGEELGRGAFGTVYYAVHHQTGDAFAAKQFRDRRCHPLKEAAILQGLSHV